MLEHPSFYHESNICPVKKQGMPQVAGDLETLLKGEHTTHCPRLLGRKPCTIDDLSPEKFAAYVTGLETPLSICSLHLSAGLEQQFWLSTPAQNVCGIMDAIALGFTLANHGLLALGYLAHILSPRQFAAGSRWPTQLCFFLPLCLLPVAAVVQIAYMMANPLAYKVNRFRIAALNRVVRLGCLCLLALGWNEHMFACGAASSSSSSTRGCLDLLRYLVAPHLIFLNHINFWTPFWFSFPIQLATLAIQLVASQRLCTCHMYNALQTAAQAVCGHMRQAAVVSAEFLVGGLQLVDLDPQRQVCIGVEASAQLQFYSATVVLLIVPTIVLYVLELNLK